MSGNVKSCHQNVSCRYDALMFVSGCASIGQCRGYMRMSPVVAVQTLWDIVRCMLTIIHCNAGICMSGVVSRLCTVCGCTIASGCVSSCTVLGVCRDVAGSGCANARGYCKVHVDCSSP